MALLLLEKLKKDINILFGYVRCLMAKSDENCPLVATEWSANHSVVTGNPYIAGTYVFWNGHVYKCLLDNNGLPPNNTTYWLDLGEGHLLAEEQSDWNATGGRRYILNKPTNTSDFFNDGEDGSSPYATINDVNAAIASPQDIDSVLGEGDTASDKDINVKSIGLWDNFAIPFGFARIFADKGRINFRSKLGNSMAWIAEGSLALVKGAFTFTINTQNLTSNRTATYQNASGVVAYLSDITGGGLVATAWSPNHTTALGNQYTVGTRVWYLGDVYEVIANNDSILPTNTSYWTNLGPGNLLDQEPIPAQQNADWNSVSGVTEILNKPIIPLYTSDLTNDGVDGVNPFITALTDAYSIKVNNTNAAANATETTYRSPGIQTYTGSIAWTGLTAPSGATTHSYNWTQIGNLVTLNITLRYAVVGSALTAVLINLPSDCPSPVKPSGLTSANEKLYIGSGRFSIGTTSSSTTPLAEASIRNNSTATGFQINMQNAASLGATLAQVTIQYFTS